jgi:hypothetical protein
VIISRHPRRSASAFTAHLPPYPTAHPPLTPLRSALPDIHRVLPVFTRNRPTLSPLEATLTRMLISVDSKWFTRNLSPLDATLTKTPGGAGAGAGAPALSAGIKMNLARTSSCLTSDTSRRLLRHTTHAEASLCTRFASPPHCFLVNYIDPILYSAGPAGHLSHSAPRPRS